MDEMSSQSERDVMTVEPIPTPLAPRDRPVAPAPVHQSEHAAAAAAAAEALASVTAPKDAASDASVPGAPPSPEELEQLTADIIGALKSVYDPEIPADIYELGLIYKIDVSDERFVSIDMTLTAPGCPVAGEMPGWVENAVNGVPGVSGTKVNLTFDPPWTPSRMSDEARLATGMF